MSDIDPALEGVMRKIQGLLNLAAKAGTPEEAEAANEKAQELLTKYNLDSATVEKNGSKDAKREDLKVDGGFYEFQRELWRAIAKVNFCLYWTQMYRAEAFRYVDKDTGAKSMRKTANNERQKVPVLKYRHAVVGRIVNTRATTIMAEYLAGAIERVVDDECKASEIEKQSNWAHSLRQGVALGVVQRLYDRYRERKAEEAERMRKQAEEYAGKGSTSKEMTLSVYIDQETDANMDFIYGEGWSAEQARARQEAAEQARREQEAYTKWAEANPEEARAREEAAKKEARKSRYSGGRSKRDNIDYSAFNIGVRRSKSISIDQQAEDRRTSTKRITGSKTTYV